MIKFTIITVCYNAEDCIEKTVRSVLSQTYPHIEYLVVDGASEDNTLGILGRYSGHGNVSIFSEEDHGIYDAMNKGVARATGNYVFFLNAGDTFCNCSVVECVAAYIQNDIEAIYYGKVYITSETGTARISDFDGRGEGIKSKLLVGDMPCHQGIFAPLCSLKEHPFREEFTLRADYEWLVYSVGIGRKCIGLPLAISNYDGRGASGTVNGYPQVGDETKVIVNEYKRMFQGQADLIDIVLREKSMSDKHLNMFLYLNQWMKRKKEGFDLAAVLRGQGFREVAIYGMGYLGERLAEELAGTGISVRYFIDRDAGNIHAGTSVYTLGDELKSVDAVIVTAMQDFHVIEAELRKKVTCPVIALRYILFP